MSSQTPCITMEGDYAMSSHQITMVLTTFISLYFILLICTFPFVRFHTPVPLFFLFLIILFPPSFLFLISYLLILRLGLLTTWWYIASSSTTTQATEVEVVSSTS